MKYIRFMAWIFLFRDCLVVSAPVVEKTAFIPQEGVESPLVLCQVSVDCTHVSDIVF